MLTSDSQVAEWQNERLPSDQISIENGGIITQCQRWPLMIDPQLQGLRWLRRHEEVTTEENSRSLHVLQMGEVSSLTFFFRPVQLHRLHLESQW